MQKSRTKKTVQRVLALAACFFAGICKKAFAVRIDPNEIDHLRTTFGMMMEGVEHFYKVTLLLESFLLFVVSAMIIVGFIGYYKVKKELRELRRHVYQEAAFSVKPQEVKPPLTMPKEELEPAVEPAPSSTKASTPLEQFIEAYSAANAIEDNTKREECLSSLRTTFSIKEFTCTNFEERKLDPNAPPTFQTKKGGDFWALEKSAGSDSYYVMPNPTLPYDEERHRFCGMKEAFASNYKEGKAYTHMELNAPAYFSQMGKLWAPQRPGKITLSRELK